MKKKLRDMSERSYNNNQFIFTDFLGMSELNDFYEIKRLPLNHEMSLFPSGTTVFGGYEEAERCMIKFGNADDLGYDIPFPIVCLNISPIQKKFADNLSHRDFLGALMNLGIERDCIGDIIVKDRECYVFVKENLSEMICNELTRVKHTTVMTKVSDYTEKEYSPTRVAKTLQASSLRIDSLVAKMLNLSRSNSALLFLSSKVYVNSRLMQNESYQLKEGDVISIRGYGKFRFVGISGNTRKGNYIINYEKYE